MNKNNIVSILLVFIIICCIFQSMYSLFYTKPFDNIENMATLDDTKNINANTPSLGEYNTPIKYLLIDFSRNNNPCRITSLSLYTMINSNIEEVDLLNGAIIQAKRSPFESMPDTYVLENNIDGKGWSSIVNGNGNDSGMKIGGGAYNKILITLSNNYIKLPDLNKIVITGKDNIMQDRLLSCSFFDENQGLVSQINLEVLHNESVSNSYKNFVYYNMSHYGNNVLPLEYSTGDISNTYFKTFYYENENKSNVENNCDQNLYNLNSLQNYNNLNASHLNMNNPPMYGLSPELSVHNSEMYENNQNLEDMMYNLEQSPNNIDYKDVYTRLPNNVIVNPLNGTKPQTYRGEIISNTEGKTAVEILREQRAQQDQNAVNQITSTGDKWCLDSNNLNKECSLMPFSDCEDLGYETYNTKSNCESARLQQQQTEPPKVKHILFLTRHANESTEVQNLIETECYINGSNVLRDGNHTVSATFLKKNDDGLTPNFSDSMDAPYSSGASASNIYDGNTEGKLAHGAHPDRGPEYGRGYNDLLITINPGIKYSDIERIVVYNRLNCCHGRYGVLMNSFQLLDENQNVIAEHKHETSFNTHKKKYINYIGPSDNPGSGANYIYTSDNLDFVLTSKE